MKPATGHGGIVATAWRVAVGLVVVTSVAATAQAATRASAPTPVPPAMHSCFAAAGRYYQIAPSLLVAIARTESRLNPRAYHRNANGTVDVGLMQINSGWFPTLQREGVMPKALMDPCMSIWIGARILAHNIDQFGYNWKSVGAYNAGGAPETQQQRFEYAKRVARHLLRDHPAGVELADNSAMVATTADH